MIHTVDIEKAVEVPGLVEWWNGVVRGGLVLVGWVMENGDGFGWRGMGWGRRRGLGWRVWRF